MPAGKSFFTSFSAQTAELWKKLPSLLRRGSLTGSVHSPAPARAQASTGAPTPARVALSLENNQHVDVGTPTKAQNQLIETTQSQQSSNSQSAGNENPPTNTGDFVGQTPSSSTPDASLKEKLRSSVDQAVRAATEVDPKPPVQASKVLENYLLALQHNHCSPATIRNYKSDINQFCSFSGEDDLKIILTKPKLTAFIENQQAKGLAPATIKRKLISIAQFSLWAKRGKLLGNPDVPSGLSQATEQELFDLIEYHTPIKAKSISKNGKPQADIVLPVAASSLPFGRVGVVVPYINLALIALFLLGLGYFGFRQFRDAEQSLAFPTTLTRPERVLSFQGRLLDQADTPIVAGTQMRFRLYDNLTGGNLLWDSNTCTIDPDVDGIFNTSLGGGTGSGSDTENCGAEIANSVFTENSNVWLQVNVGAETLSPRQPIQTVAYALNSETLQGFPASASAVENTVLIMNNSGEVVLGNSSPVIKATGNAFTLEGKALTIQTPTGSNTDISLLAGKDIVFDAGNAGVGGAVISRDYFGAPGATFSATYAGGTALTVKAGPTPTADIMRWQTSAGVNLGAIKSGGDFGIGTDQPEQKLTVSDSIQLGITDATRYIYFDNGTGSNSGVRYNATTDKMQFSHDGITWSDMLDTSGVVTSVSNIDGTLTIDPTTGDVIASLNLGNSNTWTGLQTFNNTYTDFAQYLRHEGDTNTYIEFTPDVVGITAGGKNVLSLDALAAQNLVTLGDGTDVDTRVLADSSVVSLFIEGSTGRVGIGGVTAPGEALEIGGSGTIRVGGLTANLPVKTNANKDLISGAINLASAEVSGVLPIANGGTNGTAPPTAGAVSYGTGTSYAFTGVGNSNEVLISNGSSAPSWTDVNNLVSNYWNRSSEGVIFPRTGNDVIAATSSATTVLTATQQNSSLLAARLGGTTNNASVVITGNGYLGVGNTNPTTALTVGPNSEFQVNSSGAIAAATGITSSGNINFTGINTGTTDSVITENSGLLEKRTIDNRVWGSSLVDGAGTANYVTYWVDGNSLGAEQYLNVSRGGLGADVTAGGVGELLYSTSTTAYDTLAAGTSGYVLTSNGAAAPSWVDPNTLVDNYWSRSAEGVVYPKTLNDVIAATSSATTVLTATQQNSSLLAARLGGTSDTTSLVVRGDGSVGIGTATPNNVLDIVRDQNAQIYAGVTNLNNGNMASAGTLFTSNAATGGISAQGANFAAATPYSHLAGRMYLGSTSGGGLDIVAMGGDIRFYTNDATTASERLRIATNGNIGVGDTTPDSAFTVGPNSEFQVNSSGAIAAATGITSSGNINFTGLGAGTTNDVITQNGGLLQTRAIDSRVWGTSLVDGSGTANYVTYWQDANTLTAEQYLNVTRGGLGADMTAAGAGELLYSTSATAYDTLAAGTSGYVLRSNGAAAPSWADPNTLVNNYWSRTTQGVVYPTTLNDVIAATSSATTVFTATQQNGSLLAARLGGTTDSTVMVVDGSGNVGVGDVTPSNKFAVGPNSEFQVNSSGAIAAATGITSSGTISFTGLTAGTTDTVVIQSATNTLQTRTIDSRVWGTSLVDGSGTANYNAYWSDANTLTAEQYVNVSRGGLGADMTAAGAGELLYSTSTTAYDTLAAGTSGYVLTSGGAGAPVWNDPNSVFTSYWARTAQGVVYPETLNDVVAATSSATTVFTATQQNGSLLAARLGGTTNYMTVNANGNIAFTNAGGSTITSSAGLAIDGTGAVTLGGTNATSVTVGRAGTTSTVNGDNVVLGSQADATNEAVRADRTLTLTQEASGNVTITDSGTGLDLTANRLWTLGWTGQLAATRGGTGFGSYTVGDMLYADSTTSLARLADVATGNVLLSGGVNTAPTWGKVGLGTHVSGVLPIANGGTNSSTALNNGRVMVSNGGAIVERAALATDTLLVGNATTGLAPITAGTGTAGQILVSGGPGVEPSWTSTLPSGASISFTNITSGINTQATMTVGTGASLNYSGTGTINASHLQNFTWESPGTIGSTTPNTGAFTTLSANATGNALTLSGVGANIAFTGAADGQITTATNQDLLLNPGGTGNVGINNTNPTAKLTVASPDVANSQLLLRSNRTALVTNNVLGGIDFASDDNTNAAPGSTTARIQAIAAADHTASQLATDLAFSTTTGTTMTEVMRLDDAGNVGIRNTNPTHKLTIASTTDTENQLGLRSNRSDLTANEVVGGIAFISNDNSLTIPGTTTASIQARATLAHTAAALDTELVFSTTTGTTTADAMKIDPAGRVLIGNTGTATSLFNVGSTNQFQVNSSGAIAAATGITSSGTISFTGLTAGTTDTVVIQSATNTLQTRTIDSRVWGTSLVDGSGTANYNAYWSDANTLTAEQYVNVTRGGLGADMTAAGAGELLYSTSTTAYDTLAAGTSGYVLRSNGAAAPSWVDVNGLISAYWTRTAQGIIHPTALNDGIAATSSATTTLTATQQTASLLAARLGGTTAGTSFVVEGGGDVGIGLINPAYKLDVAGDINFTGALRINGSAGNSGQILISQGASTPVWQDVSAIFTNHWTRSAQGVISPAIVNDVIAATSSAATVLTATQQNSSLLAARLGGTTADTSMVVEGSGEVGIGTATPIYRLQVHAPTTQSDIAITTNTNLGAANTTQLSFVSDLDGASPAYSSIGQFNTGDLRLSGSANLVTPDMTIASATGYVGISNTDPTAKLTIASTADTENQLHLRSNRSGISNNEIVGGIGFVSNDTSLTPPGTLTASIQGIARSTHSALALDTALVFKVTNGTTLSEAMRIDDDGQVGIATNNPTAKLSIANTTNTESQIDLRSNRSGLIAGNVIGGITFTSNDDNVAIPGITTAYIRTITTTINTAAALDTAIVFGTTAGTTLSEAMRINPNNTVSIGNTNSTYALDVTGDMSFSGALRPAGNAGTAGYILTSNGTSAPTWTNPASVGTNYWTRSAQGVISPLTLNDVIAATSSATTVLTATQTNTSLLAGLFGGTTIANQVQIRGDGAVGIGVAAGSTYKLDVNGDAHSSRYFLGSDMSMIPVAGGQSVVSSWWGMQLVGNRQASVSYSPTNIGAAGDFSVIIPNQQAAAIGLVVQGAAAQTGNLQVWRNSALTGLSAVTATGSLGIGTVSPTDRLNVVSTTAKATASPYDIATFGSSDTLGTADLNLALRVGGNATQANRWTGIQSYENGFGAQDLVLQDLGGNVGINNTLPTAKLDVVAAYTAATAGEQFGQLLTTTYSAADTSLKQGLRLNTNYSNASGTIANGIGVLSLMSKSGAGTLTESNALWTRNDVTAGTVTNAYGLRVNNGTGAGTMTNQYGVYIEDLSKGSTSNYAIYAAGDTYSYFGGNVGLGVAPTNAKLQVASDRLVSFPTPGTGAYGSIHIVPTTATVDYSTGITFGSNATAVQTTSQAGIYVQGSGAYGTKMRFATTNSFATGAQERMVIDHLGNVGIAQTTPDSAYRLDVTGNIRATGALYANANGAAYLCGGDDACLHDINIANFVGITGVQNPAVAGIRLGTGGGIISASGNTTSIYNSTNTTQLFYVNASKYAYAKRWYDIDATGYYLEPGSNGTALRIAGSIVMNTGESISPLSGSISINTGTAGTVTTDTLKVNTIDPPYWINGTRYATYAPSMIGVNEEIAQTVTLEPTGTPKLYKYVIDFDNLPEGSPLWLYSRVIDLDPYMRNLHVLVSSNHDAKVFYKKDLARRQLVFFGTAPAEISYRLTAPRFDQAEHSHVSDDQADEFGLRPSAYLLNNVPADATNLTDAELLASIESAIDFSLSDLGLINVNTDVATATATLIDQNGNLIERFTAYTEAVIGKLRAGIITTRSLTAEDIAGTNATISGTLAVDQVTTRQIEATESVKTNDLTATGETTLGKLTAGETKLGAVLAETATLSGSLSVTGQTALGSLTAQTATIAAELTTTDLTVTGTASIATGRLAYIESKLAQLEAVKANTAEITIATVSGMLYAENIADFDEKVAKTFKQTSLLATLLNQESLPPELDLPPEATQAADLKQTLAELNLSSSDIVITPAALFIKNYFEASGNGFIAGNLGIGKSLVVGNGLVITQDSIAYQPADMTADTTFSIQPAGRGKLSLLGGVMRISEGGLVEIAGDLWVAGNIRAELAIEAKGDVNTDKDFNTKGTLASNTIRPLNSDEALQVKVSEQDVDSGEIKRSRFEIVDELGTPVATISADGKARFAGLSVNSEDVSATGSGTLNTSQSAGKARLTAGQTEIILKSESITAGSLIYVTPLSSTNNQVLYVKAQIAENLVTPEKEGEFRVGVDVPVATDIEFNWWIVN